MIKNNLPSDLAVCFSTTGSNILAASFNEAGEINLFKYDGGGSFYLALQSWRESLGHSTDLQTVFRFIPFQFTEQTYLPALPEDVKSFDDKALTLWLIDAASRGISGDNGLPLFDSSLQKSAYDYARLPDGNISLTEVPRERLHEALKQLMQAEPLNPSDIATLTRYVADESQPHLLHAVETRLRTITRYVGARDDQQFDSLADDESVAVFAFTPEGCGFSLWNPGSTFYAEYGEWFNLHFDENDVPEDINRADYITQLYLDSVYNFLHEQFVKRVVPEDESTDFIKISKIYWTASDGLELPLEQLLSDIAEETNFRFHRINEIPQEEMIVRGLLMAHDETAEARVPSINLANDISVQNDSINAEELNLKAVAQHKQRQRVFACLMLPIIIAFGAIIGLWLNNQRIAASLAWRESAAKAEQSRLKPILQARADYEKTLKWYEDVLRQIVALRQKQTSSLSFAARLDPLYPQEGAFYVSDMKLMAGGAFEIKGFTKNELEVSRFVNSMEFAVDEKETRYFTGLQLEFKQSSEMSGSTQIGTSGNNGISLGGNLAPGMSGFVVKGNFTPAAVLKAQTPQNAAPVAQPPSGSVEQKNPAPPVANSNQGATK